jgi:competence protein ComEA
MPELPRGQLAVYAAVAAAIVLIGARYLRGDDGDRGGEAQPVPVHVDRAGSDGGGSAVVQVAGEVRRPGVYRLRAGQRVDHAVRLAGGPTERADLTGVNLAAKVEDGRQVIVPARGAASVSAPGAVGGGAGGQLNLNTATVEQLDELDGVGPATARKIVAYRQQHGGFRSVAELDQVPGIGPKRLAALKDRLRV